MIDITFSCILFLLLYVSIIMCYYLLCRDHYSTFFTDHGNPQSLLDSSLTANRLVFPVLH